MKNNVWIVPCGNGGASYYLDINKLLSVKRGAYNVYAKANGKFVGTLVNMHGESFWIN